MMKRSSVSFASAITASSAVSQTNSSNSSASDGQSAQKKPGKVDEELQHHHEHHGDMKLSAAAVRLGLLSDVAAAAFDANDAQWEMERQRALESIGRADLVWVKSAFEETVASRKEWHRLKKKLAALIVEFVEDHAEQVQTQQCLFSMVGSQFVTKHFPDAQIQPMLLREPYMLESVYLSLRAHLEGEFMDFLDDRLPHAIYSTMEHRQYKHAVGKVFRRSFQREAERRRQVVESLNDAQRHEVVRQMQMEATKQGNEKARRYMQSSFITEIKRQQSMKDSDAAAGTTSAASTAAAAADGNSDNDTLLHEAKYDSTKDSDVSRVISERADAIMKQRAIVTDWTKPSHIAAEALVALCQTHPDIEKKLVTLGGRLLPTPLRKYVWGRFTRNEQDLQQVTHDLLENARHWRITDLDQSPIQGLIDRIIDKAIMDMFHVSSVALDEAESISTKQASNSLAAATTPTTTTASTSTASLSVNVRIARLRRSMRRVLNRFYIHSEQYGFAHTLLACQLLAAFPNDDPNLATGMLVNLLDTCVPRGKKAKEIAEALVFLLRARDPSFYKHLQECFSGTTAVQSAADTDEAGGGGGSRGLVFPVSPAAVMQRWLEYGFVGFLSPVCTLFVWDQCFLFGWKMISDFALEVLFLLKRQLLRANTAKLVDKITAVDTRHIGIGQLALRMQPYVDKQVKLYEDSR